MSKPAWTPGPWEAEGGPDESGYWVTGPDRDKAVICDLVGRQYVDGDMVFTNEDHANAHLIAASPCLYAVVEKLVALNESGLLLTLTTPPEQLATVRKAFTEARSALAKARGEQ